MVANKEKYINLIFVHVLVLFAIFVVGFFIKDSEEIRHKQEECDKYCHPAKAVKSISLRSCMCYEEEVDNENKQE